MLVLDYAQSLKAMAQDIRNTASEAAEIELWALRNIMGNWGVPLSFLPEHLAVLEPVIYIGAALAIVMATVSIMRRCTYNGNLWSLPTVIIARAQFSILTHNFLTHAMRSHISESSQLSSSLPRR